MTKLQGCPLNMTIEGGYEVVYRAANASKTCTKIHLKLCKDRALKTVLKFILNPVKTEGLRQFGHSLLAVYSWIKSEEEEPAHTLQREGGQLWIWRIWPNSCEQNAGLEDATAQQ